MEDHADWMSPFRRQQQRPMSMPMTYEGDDDDQMALHRVSSNSANMYAPHSRSIPVSSTPASMPISIPIPSHPSVIPGNILPSAPASPPTPAPSPSPTRAAPDWRTAAAHEELGLMEDDDGFGIDSHSMLSRGRSLRSQGVGYRHIRSLFADMGNEERMRMLAELLNMCDGKTLGFVAGFVGPRLKRDPFGLLPNELCLRILTFIDDAKTLARSSQVSKRWHELVSDDMAWKSLCEKHAYRRMSNDASTSLMRQHESPQLEPTSAALPAPPPFKHPTPNMTGIMSMGTEHVRSRSLDRASSSGSSHSQRRPKAMTYRSHFKRKYQAETAWRTGGQMDRRQITQDQGLVTCLHMTDRYIMVALDNARIHVFDTAGKHLRCLVGHVMGVWAMVPWEDILVSGGCDREVRVWNMSTGKVIHKLHGHTSTVRCLKMSDSRTAISGSRDTTLRVWDIETGICKHILIGHQSSVRCLEIHGDLVVSGSYDTTARIWSISEGRCLRTLQGHFSQIYAVAFDGNRVATGSLDTIVRVWNASDGRCIAILQGHTSLVGQLQLRHDTLVSGGSDGSVRVWSLNTFTPIHRLAAHDNSVTSLQFDDSRIVSGGSDGRVKVWDLARGTLIRELGQPAEAVWRVVFEEEKAVILASRGGKTYMEVWNFAPPADELEEQGVARAGAGLGIGGLDDGAAAAAAANSAAGLGKRFGSPVSLPERAGSSSSSPSSSGLVRREVVADDAMRSQSVKDVPGRLHERGFTSAATASSLGIAPAEAVEGAMIFSTVAAGDSGQLGGKKEGKRPVGSRCTDILMSDADHGSGAAGGQSGEMEGNDRNNNDDNNSVKDFTADLLHG